MKKSIYTTLAITGLFTWFSSEIFILFASEAVTEPVTLILVRIAFILGMVFTYIGAPLAYTTGRIVELFGTDPYTILYPGIYPLTNTVSVLILVIAGMKICKHYKASKGKNKSPNN